MAKFTDDPTLTITRRAEFAGSSVNVEKRTVDLVWTTGARVMRSSWFDGPFYEELSLEPGHVRLDRLNNGAPLLADHYGSTENVRGAVVPGSARIENGQGVATVRFPTEGISPESDKLFALIRDGIIQNVSVGYRTFKSVEIENKDNPKIPIFRAVDWQPSELSAVAMGADDAAGFRSSTTQTEGRKMSVQKPEANNPENPEDLQARAVALERERVSGILTSCRAGKLEREFADQLIAEGVGIDEARELILHRIYVRSNEVPTNQHGGAADANGGVVRRDANGRMRITGGNDLGHQGLTRRLELQSEALAARARGVAASGEAAQYSRLSMVDHARHCLEAQYINTRMMSDSQVVTRAMSSAGTSDFVALLTSTGDRAVQSAYQAAAGGLKQISRRSSAKDYRAKSLLFLSEAPKLLEVKENAEITAGSMTENVESYSVKTFARKFGLSRQAIQNDDTGAFQVAAAWGRAAAEFENQSLVDLIVANPAMRDTYPLFSTQHGNLAGTGTVISIASLAAGMKALRLMKDLDGTTPINVVPDRLIVPAALEGVALQYTAQITAAQQANVQPFALSVIVDSRLDASSSTAWYLASSQVPCLEYSYLDGQEGPIVDVQSGWERLGVEWRVVLDWGCGVIDFRGAYKNPGA